MRRLTTFVGSVAAASLLLGACSPSPDRSPQLTTYDTGLPLAGVGALPRPASAWPQAGYDGRRSSGTKAVGPQTARVRWRTRLEGDATPGPVLAADGSVLAATQGGHLYALDQATGRVQWRFDGGAAYSGDLSTSPAVLGNGTILWPGPNSTLFALDAGGHRLWSLRLGGQVLSPAVAGAGRAYVTSLAGDIVALEVSARVPKVAWHLRVAAPDYASPAVAPDGTIVTASGKDLVAVRDLGRRGAVAWRLRVGALIEVSPSVSARGIVVVGTNGDREYGVGTDGAVRWSTDIGDYTYSSSVTRPGGLTTFGDNSGRVWAIDTRTGRTRLRLRAVPGDNHLWTSVIADAHGDLYGATQAHAFGYDARGKRLWSFATSAPVNSYPALGADGTLYFGATDGAFYAVGR